MQSGEEWVRLKPYRPAAVYRISGGTLSVTGKLNVGAALASNAVPDATRTLNAGQAARAKGTFIVSGSASSITINGDLLANPADKTRPAADANASTLIFEILDATGTSLINLTSAADRDRAVIDPDLFSFTPAPGTSSNLLSALKGIGGPTGTGTTKRLGEGPVTTPRDAHAEILQHRSLLQRHFNPM